MAERVGFEPTVRLPVQRFSRPSRSTTPAPLRQRSCSLPAGARQPFGRRARRRFLSRWRKALSRRPRRPFSSRGHPAPAVALYRASSHGRVFMHKTGSTAPRKVMRFVAAIAAFVALPALPGHAVEESKSETIGPWEIEAVFRGATFDRCAINREVRDGIVARFVRTGDGLILELESPNWKLERGKNYPVKMAMGRLSSETEGRAE